DCVGRRTQEAHRSQAPHPGDDFLERRHPPAELLPAGRRGAGRGDRSRRFEVHRGLCVSSRSRHTKLIVVLVAVAALLAPAAASAGIRGTRIDATHFPTIRATIVSSSGSRVQPALTENNQPVTGFQATNLASSKSVVIAIDRSRSMRTKFGDAIAAARGYVGAKPPSDQIAVLAFGSAVVKLSRFSAVTDDSDAALQGVAIDSHNGTALYDAVGAATDELSSQDGGRVLILLTDGTDTTSKAKLSQVAAQARDDNVLIYP